MTSLASGQALSHSFFNPYLSERYEVFISHRGPDCKATVARLLKTQLEKQPAISKAFLDELDLVHGGHAQQQMEHAIGTCKVHFSGKPRCFRVSFTERIWRTSRCV